MCVKQYNIKPKLKRENFLQKINRRRGRRRTHLNLVLWLSHWWSAAIILSHVFVIFESEGVSALIINLVLYSVHFSFSLCTCLPLFTCSLSFDPFSCWKDGVHPCCHALHSSPVHHMYTFIYYSVTQNTPKSYLFTAHISNHMIWSHWNI